MAVTTNHFSARYILRETIDNINQRLATVCIIYRGTKFRAFAVVSLGHSSHGISFSEQTFSLALQSNKQEQQVSTILYSQKFYGETNPGEDQAIFDLTWH